MPQLSVIVSDQNYRIVKAVLAATGKTQSSACGEWIYKGALSELQELQKAGIIPNPLPGFNVSTDDVSPVNNGKAKSEVPPAAPEGSPVDTPSTTKEPKYEDGTVIKIIKVPKSMRNKNLLNENGIVHRQAGKGKWLIHLADGTEIELPEACIEPEKNVR